MSIISGNHRPSAIRVRMLGLAAAVVVSLLHLPLVAQTSAPQSPSSGWADQVLKQETYATPPFELADAVMAPRHLNVTLSNPSPDKKWFLDEIGDGPVAMKTFSKPFHELGGVFVDLKANRARALTIRNSAGIQVLAASDGSVKVVQTPSGARVSNATWSPDGKTIAYFVHGEDATHIWLADTATGQSRQLTRTPVLATLFSSFEFSANSAQVAVVQIPDGRPAMPAAPLAPTGPTVKIADTDKNRQIGRAHV